MIDHKAPAWSWRPVRVAGRNAIAVYRGRRLVTLLGPHEVDDAHALVTLRNLAAGTRVNSAENGHSHKVFEAAPGGRHGADAAG